MSETGIFLLTIWAVGALLHFVIETGHAVWFTHPYDHRGTHTIGEIILLFAIFALIWPFSVPVRIIAKLWKAMVSAIRAVWMKRTGDEKCMKW